MNAKTVPDLTRAAELILRANDRGGATVPAPTLYPHQWNWDSAFCALGWMHLDARRAARELEMLLRGQWANGLVPHILFDPSAEHYAPGPLAWGTIDAPGSPAAVRTSSITQPPVLATAARRVLERAGGDREVEDSLRRVAEGAARWHAWFMTERDAGGGGVPAIVHPWESGMDNAPRWDGPMSRIEPGAIEYERRDDQVVHPAERPTRYDYDRYFFIVGQRAAGGFAAAHPARDALVVEDVALVSILARAEEDLVALVGALGLDPALAAAAGARRERLVAGIQARLYDPARASYHDRDVRTGEALVTDHAAHLLPLFAGIAPPAAVERAVSALAGAFDAPWPVPTVPLDHRDFDGRRYWRGPTWINLNWLLVEGLERCGQGVAAARLRERSLELITRSGFREYFDPRSGEGLGASDFSWTAALAIDWLAR